MELALAVIVSALCAPVSPQSSAADKIGSDEHDEVLPIELSLDDAGGASGSAAYEAAFVGSLYAWARSTDLDLRLEVRDEAGHLRAATQAPVSTPFLRMPVRPGDELTVVVTGTRAETGTVLLHLVPAPDAASIPSLLDETRSALGEVSRLRTAGDLTGARAVLSAAVARVVGAEGADASATVADLLKEMQGTALALSDLRVMADCLGTLERHLVPRLPPEHGDLQTLRFNMGAVLKDLGEVERARDMLEWVVAVRSRTLAPDDPRIVKAKSNLGLALMSLGDLRGAQALLEEVDEVFSRHLPPDDPNCLKSKQNLVVVRSRLGDHEAAREVLEHLFEITSRDPVRLAGEHRSARLNLAALLLEEGDAATARTLLEEGLREWRGDLPPNSPELSRLHQVLAIALKRLGEYEAALELERHVLETRAAMLPEDDLELVAARVNLANTLAWTGDLEGARDGLRSALAGVGGEQVPTNPVHVAIVRSLARVDAQAGDWDDARGLGSLLARARERTLVDAALTTGPRLSLLLTLASGAAGDPADPVLESEVFRVVETVRAAAITSARLALSAGRDEETARLLAASRKLTRDLVRLAQGGDREAVAGTRSERDRVQRALAGRLADSPASGRSMMPPTVERLKQGLRTSEALVAFWSYERWRPPDGSRPESYEEHLLAWVLQADRPLVRIELGPLAPIDGAVSRWRKALLAGRARGEAVLDRSQPSEREAGEALRALVFDPLEPALGDARLLDVALDGALHVVPFDALPEPEGGRLGDRIKLRVRSTLRERLWAEEGPPGGGPLLVLGGASYGAEPEPLETGDAPPRGSAGSAVADSGPVTVRGSWDRFFKPLTSARSEARTIAALFEQTVGGSQPVYLLEGRRASREAVLQLAPGARWIHLATHGWIAPESVRSAEDPVTFDLGGASLASTSLEDRIKGTSPMILCGLAFTGANLPPDGTGRIPGTLTAEELATVDLSACELAVLSACDTHGGERRAGQGVASLQKSLHMAGARTTITSLWQVSDFPTEELMVELYRRIWIDEEPLPAALWTAKRKLREARDESGSLLYAPREWAGWVLTGGPLAW